MKRAFFSIALLAASWLPGIGYFHLQDPLACAALIAVGLGLLIGTREWELEAGSSGISAILCAIAAVWTPWPYRAIPLLLAIGLALRAFPISVRWPRAFGNAAITAGVVLLGQALVMFAYTQLTARSHELPDWLAEPIVGIANLIGISAAYDGHSISLGTMRINYPMAPSWELLIDPATLCFLIGGLLFIGRKNWRGDLILIASVLLWNPIRIALMLGLFMHRAMRLDYDAPILLMDQFWNTWIYLLLLLGPATLAAILIPSPAPRPSSIPPPRSHVALAGILATIGGVLLAFALFYDPIGVRQKGRVMFDEIHRADRPDNTFHGWEPTDTVFDTESYGHNAAYTYCVLYDYLSHFYDVSRLTQKIDDQSLSACDVFIIKVPTKQLDSTEVTALTRFVARGGGLLLIGEHTDVFGTGTYLNDVARKFGFRFRYDCLFDIDQVFQQRYHPSIVEHPIVQNLPELDFAVSCSIAPPMSFDHIADRGVIVSSGLRSLPADYHASNFYPQVEDRADTRYGSFVQLWAQRYMNGRVVAFTDSTQFSNFCLFDPGKSELMQGMVEWLNHRTTGNEPRLPLLGIGAIAMLAAWSLARARASSTLLALGGALFGWAISLPAIAAVQKHAMPLPPPIRPLTRVVMDRTVCDSTLPLAGFIAGKPDGYGIFERWILRLGYFTTRRSGDNALHDNVLIFATPDKPVSPAFRDSVEHYVSAGGKIVVIDSAENQNSTANSLLAPYGVHFKRDASVNGDLDVASTVTTTQPATTTVSPIPVTNAVEVATDEGIAGDTVAKISDKPVSMMLHHGQGTVTLVGYGTRFSDLNMGFTGDNEPDAGLRAVYQVEFDLLRKIVEGN